MHLGAEEERGTESWVLDTGFTNAKLNLRSIGGSRPSGRIGDTRTTSCLLLFVSSPRPPHIIEPRVPEEELTVREQRGSVLLRRQTTSRPRTRGPGKSRELPATKLAIAAAGRSSARTQFFLTLFFFFCLYFFCLKFVGVIFLSIEFFVFKFFLLSFH